MKTFISESAWTFSEREPLYDEADNLGRIVNRIGEKRATLGYLDDDGIAFTVPIVERHCDGKVTRLITDIENAQFKRIR